MTEKKEPKIIGVKEALKLAKAVPGAKYLFLDQNGDWNTTETYLKDFSNPKNVDVGELTRHPKNGKTLGSAGDVGGLDVIWVWDISTGKKMWDFTTTNVLKESFSFNEYLEFLTEGATKQEIDDETYFKPEVKELLKSSHYVLSKDVTGEYFLTKLGKIKSVGEFKVTIRPYIKGDVVIDIGLESIDKEQGHVSLAEAMIEKLTKQKLDKVLKYAETMFSNLDMVESIK